MEFAMRTHLMLSATLVQLGLSLYQNWMIQSSHDGSMVDLNQLFRLRPHHLRTSDHYQLYDVMSHPLHFGHCSTLHLLHMSIYLVHMARFQVLLLLQYLPINHLPIC